MNSARRRRCDSARTIPRSSPWHFWLRANASPNWKDRKTDPRHLLPRRRGWYRLSYHLQTKLTPGGLINAWQRLPEILLAWDEPIAEEAKNHSAEWRAFAKKLRRLLRDGIRLRKRPDFAPKRYQGRIDRLNRRVGEMAREEHTDADARRLTKRLRRYGEYIFTFLDYSYVPHDNNFGERQIRPAVILRKNSPSNRSDRGAATQAVLMSVYRTLRLRGLNPTKTIADALKTYLTTGKLPQLPK